MYEDIHFYIDFSWEHHVGIPENYLRQVNDAVKFVYQHKATVYYSKKQIENFVSNLIDLDEFFSQSHGNELALILQNAIGLRGHKYIFDLCFAKENTSLSFIDNLAISSIMSNPKIAIISPFANYEAKSLLFVDSNSVFERIDVNTLGSISDIYDWLVQNVEKRVFNLSKKHGENGEGNWPGESVLLCNRDEAQEILNKAIPDFAERKRELFYFDDERKTYIDFYYEGDNPQKQWHGFHIDAKLWNKRVPKSIRNFFGR